MHSDFDTKQAAYTELRDTIKLQTTQLVLFLGAGISALAGLPSWGELKKALIARAKEKLSNLVPSPETEKQKKLLDYASCEPDGWRVFSHLREILGQTSYTTAIRTQLGKATDLSPPDEYVDLWKIGAKGIITLNIDQFASRSFATAHGDKPLRIFEGIDAGRHGDVAKTGTEFVCNLHGRLDSDQSWIFTAEELKHLQENKAYNVILQTIFASKTVVFLGVTADDSAIAKHLEKLLESGIGTGPHYWLTDRNDHPTAQWCEKLGVRPIFYPGPKHWQPSLKHILADLAAYIPHDPPIHPITPSTKKERNVCIPPSADLESLPAEEIRQALNREAARILKSNDPLRYETYTRFWGDYDESIYRAWSVNPKGRSPLFMGYTLEQSLHNGGFGSVYPAIGQDGKKYAVKILHSTARSDQKAIDAFRRGVEAMRILTERKVPGVVPYTAAWDIPPSAVMEYIEGPNLAEAVKSGLVKDWSIRLTIAHEIVAIIMMAHGTAEKVLHRDIRPANIMLKDFWDDPNRPNVVILDFDLSWYRDARGNSVDLNHATSGYLAPEQLSSTGQTTSTRNALVDSHGIGMTLFYLATETHPIINQCIHRNWEATVKDSMRSKKCPQWKSIPSRFGRLILSTTNPIQNRRWDLSRIQGELSQLQAALQGTCNVTLAELFAEEIAANIRGHEHDYVWDPDKCAARIELRHGFIASIRGDESNKSLHLSISWISTGDRKFENVKKYVGSAAERAASALKKKAWRNTSHLFSSASIDIEASLNVSDLRAHGALNNAVAGLESALAELRLDAV